MYNIIYSRINRQVSKYCIHLLELNVQKMSFFQIVICCRETEFIHHVQYNSSYLLRLRLGGSPLYHIFISIPWLMLWLNPMWNILLNWNVPLGEYKGTQTSWILYCGFNFCVYFFIIVHKVFGKVFFYWKNCIGFWVS